MTTRARRRGAADDGVYRITGTARSHTEDLNERVRRYVVSMTIRVVCVVMAFVVEGWLRWVFVAGAVVLPYVAVVAANAGRERNEPPPPTTFLPPSRTALPPGRPDGWDSPGGAGPNR